MTSPACIVFQVIVCMYYGFYVDMYYGISRLTATTTSVQNWHNHFCTAHLKMKAVKL